MAQAPSDVDLPGRKEISVRVGEPGYNCSPLTNKSAELLAAVTINRSEVPEPVFGPRAIAPGGTANGTDIFTPTRAGTYDVVARAFGLDPQGNWVSALPSRVRVTALPPACAQSVVPLNPDPNPVDLEGQPFSSVMLGGRLLGYYRVIDSDSRPVPNATVKVEKRELPGGAFEHVTNVATGPDGLIVHTAPGASTPEPGLRLDAATIGQVDQQFEIRVYTGDEFGPCGVRFEAEVTPRQFTASIKGGASIQAEAALELNLSGAKGAGFELKLDRQTTAAGGAAVDTKVTVTRSMDAKLGVGVKFATTEAGFSVGGTEISLGNFDPSARAEGQLMLRDRHEFEPPLGLRGGAAIGQLFLGLIAVSAVPGTLSPTGPMLAIGLNELAERVSGLDDFRRGFGGGVGIKLGAGAIFGSQNCRFSYRSGSGSIAASSSR